VYIGILIRRVEMAECTKTDMDKEIPIDFVYIFSGYIRRAENDWPRVNDDSLVPLHLAFVAPKGKKKGLHAAI
jgi:hypothetical protein